MKKIVFTGGGTAGHVNPNIALIDRLDRDEWEIHYIGMKDGVEEKLIKACEGVTFHQIAAGKMRRYFSLKNVSDVFRVIKGVSQAKRLIKAIRPDVLFSKGGFVSVPVVMAAKRRCPVIIHESDYTPGLANRIASRYADYICVTFRVTADNIKGKKQVLHTGTPIRDSLLSGSRQAGLDFCKLSGNKPVLLVMGGSQGAKAINDTLISALPKLLEKFDVVHLCGEGKRSSFTAEGYVQFEYIREQMADLLAMADLIVSRAGANAVFEFLALQKPSILIPLPLAQSRGDQIQNADYFEKCGFAKKLEQDGMSAETLIKTIDEVYGKRATYVENMKRDGSARGTDAILNLIFKVVEHD
ncbi:MAG: undecaprenyldiphospho-muramoylpentapeptide beta-N-acetylglucosaminyltransferase [Clostridia bacterium]|nr:undecaprenyldiphospho-muramoylpentapeptide beta-N-acetylglucosaminyltransferase [Clostridia bacterium]